MGTWGPCFSRMQMGRMQVWLDCASAFGQSLAVSSSQRGCRGGACCGWACEGWAWRARTEVRMVIKNQDKIVIFMVSKDTESNNYQMKCILLFIAFVYCLFLTGFAQSG